MRLTIFVFLGTLLALASPTHAGTKIVTTTYPLALIASAVAPTDTELKHLVPTAIPFAQYRPGPDDLTRLAEAQVIVWGGPEIEPGFAGAIGGLTGGQRVFTLSRLPGIVTRELRTGHGDRVAYGADPNLWYSTRNAAILATALGAHLGNPLAAEHFDAELSRFRERQTRRFAPIANVPLLVSQDSHGFLFEEIGLRNVIAVTPGPAFVASPQRIAEIAARVGRDHIACMAGEPGFETALAPQLFPTGHANLIALDPQLGSLNLSRSSYTLSVTYLAETIYNCLVTR